MNVHTTTQGIPAAIVTAYGLEHSRITPVFSLINRTFMASEPGRTLVVQRLHPVFDPRIHHDIRKVTEHLRARGIETAELVVSQNGRLWEVDAEGGVWRTRTFLPGRTFDSVESPAQARSAAGVVAQFHRALSTLDHHFAFGRPGVHDTERHFEQLESILTSAQLRAAPELARLGTELTELRTHIRTDFTALPRRICHGDLKISNVLFHANDPRRARCLIDFDTLGRQFMAFELGDTLRSWCNPAGEDARDPDLDIEIFRAAVEGYAAAAAPESGSSGEAAPSALLDPAEIDAIVDGLETVCIELAIRFWVDAVENRYFAWDDKRFASRREHNLVRARCQLALGRSVTQRKGQLVQITRRAFASGPTA